MSSADSQHRKPEFLTAEIIFNNVRKLLLAVVYRPPNCGYLDEFMDIFQDLQTNYQHAMIFGDFNADMSTRTFDSIQIENFVSTSGMYLIPYGATHHLTNSVTFLDLCIIDDVDKLINYDKAAVPFLSAHDLIEVTYGISVEKREERRVLCRDYRSFDREVFLSEVSELDWSEIMTLENMENKVRALNDKLLSCLNKHAPLKHICFKNLPAPWLTDEIRDAMHARDVARRLWRRTKNITNHERFKTKRNHVQNLIRTAKKNYYMTFFCQKDKPALIWSKLKHLGLIKAKNSNGRLALSVDKLNLYFADAGVELQDLTTEESNGGNPGREDFDDSKFYFKYVGPEVIRRSLCCRSNAVGLDGITPKLIQMTLPYIMPVIEHLYNFSLMYGVVPAVWKSAVITPIPKINHPTLVQHYRPISILP
ncbi:rna-directed dna polymerase from mobile element jockey-like protein, partial [Lasius niger]